MSRCAAVAARVEELIAAIVPETKTVGGPRFTRSDKPLGLDAAPRTFYVEASGQIDWTGEVASDREGAIVEEVLELSIAYRGSASQRTVRDAIRQDVMRIQYELLDPGNWVDTSSQWRCQRRQFDGYTIARTGDGDAGQLLVTMPITLTYRPF